MLHRTFKSYSKRQRVRIKKILEGESQTRNKNERVIKTSMLFINNDVVL